MARFSHSTLSKVAIWVATYAFVLNTILASMLISSVPAQALAGADAFCGSMQGASPLDHGDDANSALQQAAAHCKQCCANHPGGALASAGPLTFGRVGVTEPQRYAFATKLKRYARVTQNFATGPPTLI